MWNYTWPILVAIASNVFYNISAKATPSKINPFASLTVTYIIAAVASSILYYIFSPTKSILSELQHSNWSIILMGFAIIGIEFGYIQIYRAGWNISIGPLVANTGLALMLILIGTLFYRVQLSLNKLLGIVLCIIGLVFINK